MSVLRWFEIPVADMERARHFYETVLKVDIAVIDMRAEMGSILGMFPDHDGTGGTLVQNEQHGYVPSQTGALNYLTVGDEDMNDAVARAEAAGAQILLPKTSLGENGYCAWILDTEGNRMGLHSTK